MPLLLNQMNCERERFKKNRSGLRIREKISHITYCIKGREVLEDCLFAWIGSPTAHREFQMVRDKDNNGRASDRTRMAFLEIVQSCSDDSVGGFCITAGYNQSLNALGYRECKTFQNSKSQIVKPGDNIKFYMSAMDGGFRLNRFQSPKKIYYCE